MKSLIVSNSHPNDCVPQNSLGVVRSPLLCVVRYHCNYREHEPMYPEEEQRFQKAAVDVQEGLWSLSKRYQGLLMNESMVSPNIFTTRRLNLSISLSFSVARLHIGTIDDRTNPRVGNQERDH